MNEEEKQYLNNLRRTNNKLKKDKEDLLSLESEINQNKMTQNEKEQLDNLRKRNEKLKEKAEKLRLEKENKKTIEFLQNKDLQVKREKQNIYNKNNNIMSNYIKLDMNKIDFKII